MYIVENLITQDAEARAAAGSLRSTIHRSRKGDLDTCSVRYGRLLPSFLQGFLHSLLLILTPIS